MEMTEDITEVMTTNSTFILPIQYVPGDIRDSVPKFLIISIFNIIISITGVIGNGLVLIVVLNTRNMWDATNLLIANQSLIDFFASLFVILDFVPVPPFETAGHALARFLCFAWYNHYFVWALSNASIFNLVFISFERFYAVRYPIRYRSNFTVKPALAASALAWIMGGGWFWFLPASSRLEDGICRSPVWPTENTVVAVTVSTFLMLYLFPLIIMTTIYGYIGKILKRGSATQKFQNQGAAGPTPNAVGGFREIARRKVMKTMILVTVTSLLCWTPSNLLFIAYSLGANISFTGIENATVQTIMFANNSINPFIYTFNYHKFQEGLRRLFRLRDSNALTGAGKDGTKTSSTNVA